VARSRLKLIYPTEVTITRSRDVSQLALPEIVLPCCSHVNRRKESMTPISTTWFHTSHPVSCMHDFMHPDGVLGWQN
jgi:hypothetical protein